MLPDSAYGYIHRKPGVYTENTSLKAATECLVRSRAAAAWRSTLLAPAMKGASWAVNNADTPSGLCDRAMEQDKRKTGSGWVGEKQNELRREERRKPAL